MIFLYRPRLYVLRQNLVLKTFGDAVFLRITLVIPAARLAHIQYLARLTELLVSHLQHLYNAVYLALFRLVHAPYREQEIGEVGPLGTARNGINVERWKRFVTVLVLDSRVSHHYRPYMPRTAPCLQLRQHQPHLLRLRGTAATLRHVDEYVGIYHQEVETVLAHVALSHRYDVVAVGQARLRVEVYHVLRHVVDNLTVHLPCLALLHGVVHAGGVFHAQCHPCNLPYMLCLDRLLEGEEGYALLTLEHQMSHHAVQEIRLSRVRDARQDDESAIGSRVEDAVGLHAHPHVVTLVVDAHHHLQDVGLVLVQVVDVLCRHILSLLYNSSHLAGPEVGIYVADVLAVAR